MSGMKRAGLYLFRKKGKTLSLLAFLLVMATMVLACLSIQSAAQDAAENVKKALRGSFTVNAKTLEGGLPEQMVDKILSINGQSGSYALRAYTQASLFDAEGKPLKIQTEGAASVPEGYEHAGKIVANSDSNQDAYFTEAGFALTQGTAITPGQENVALLHEDFAKRNGLSVGDTILLGKVEGQAQRTQVRIQGLFANTERQDSLGMAPSYDLYENVVFTDPSACSYLIYGEPGRCQYGDFYVDDPEALDSMITKVRRIPGVEWRKCVITKYDKDYQNAKAPLESLQNIVRAAMAVVTGTGFLLLALLLTFRLRNRVHEIGVLLAVGISKKAILLQQLTEVLIVAALSLVLAFASSSLIAGQAGNSLLARAAAKYEVVNRAGGEAQSGDSPQPTVALAEIHVSVSAEDYILVWAAGFLFCGAAATLATLPVLKTKPKNILSQMR